MGFIDMQDVSDENLCDIDFELKNLVIKPNSVEEHSIYVEAELEISCNVSQSKQMNIIEDLYSPTEELSYNQKQMQVISKKEIIKDMCSIREKQLIPEIGNHKIYDVQILPTITNKKILNERIVYEGQIELNFLFEAENTSRMDIKNVVIPFNFTLESKKLNLASNVETKIEILTQDFTLMSDGTIDIKIDLNFIAIITNKENLQLIEEIQIDETRKVNCCSLIVYFVKQGDTLWNIAKRFRSTVEDIAQMNDIEDENKISIGQQLFIPNCAN